MILTHSNGNMIACQLISETKKSWLVNYKDKAFPGNKRIPKNSNYKLFENVDQALDWLGINYDQ